MAAEAQAGGWQGQVYRGLRGAGVDLFAYVPDAGHKEAIVAAQAEAAVTALCLANEAEGIGLLAGYHLGGGKGVLLMQSSGVGNCINQLSLVTLGRFPFLTLVTMRGEFGEQNPWQYPMGQATPACLAALGLLVLRADGPDELPANLAAALEMAFGAGQAVALLLGQRLIGAKAF